MNTQRIPVESALARERGAALSRAPPQNASAAKDDLSFKLLKRGASGAFLVQVAGAGLGLIVHLIIARLLGAEQYGIYALTLTWVGVLSVFALLGQSTSVVRFLSTYMHHGEWDKARGLRRGASLIVLVASVAIAVAGTLLVYLIRARLGGTLERSLLMGFVLLPILTQLQLSGALHRALKRAVSSGIFNNILRPIVLLSVVLGLWLGLHEKLSAPLMIAASAVAALIAFAASSWVLAGVWPRASKDAPPAYEFRVWSTVGGHLFLLAAIGITLNRLDVLVLGGLGSGSEVGAYYAAVKLAATVGYGLTAVNTILAPMIAERYSAGKHEALAKLVHRAAWLTFAVTATAAAVLAVAGRLVLSLFGPQFTAAYVPLLIILAGQCLNAATGPVGYLMTMTRFERQALLIFCGGALLNLLLSILLIPLLGMIGAAIATATATVAWNLVALAFVLWRINVNPTIFRLATA